MVTGYLGAITATFFFLLFQLCGLVLAFSLLPDRRYVLRLLAGSVAGSVLLQWTPCLFAFFLGFGLPAHLLAALLCVLAAAGAWIWKKPGFSCFFPKTRSLSPLIGIILALPFLVFAALTLHGLRIVDGIVFSSQCTWGDMSMHLGFVTGIATQGVFPPEYSILPGTALSYPFLSDTVSSSLLVWGAPLPFAYFLPMLFAGAQVVGGACYLLHLWLKSGKRTVLAMVLFFFNGGFGFAYFLSGTKDNPQNFTRIFTEFYQTPTNLVDQNIRWVNVIVDMLVPQRATLFGWAVLFTALCLLFEGIHHKSLPCFLFTGVLAGALPMIHTHSFLVLGLVSGTWLILQLLEAGLPTLSSKWLQGLMLAFPLVFWLLSFALGNERENTGLLLAAGGIVLLLALTAIALPLLRPAARPLLPRWAAYLGIALALAVPQLLFWTFRQAQGEQFTRGYFNWGNQNDDYLWFYLKNVGIAALLYVPAVLAGKKRLLQTTAPLITIMVLSELVVFQPNNYDNNKLIYIAYFFLCALVADFLADTYHRLKACPARPVLAGILLFFSTISAGLTIGREAVAEYELFGTDHVKAAEYIKENASPQAVVLTDQRNNNSIPSLSGRNIVCGSPSFLFYHGLDYAQRPIAIAAFYADPLSNEDILEKYKVDYVMVSDYERGNFQVDEAAIAQLFPLVFQQGQVSLYQVTTS